LLSKHPNEQEKIPHIGQGLRHDHALQLESGQANECGDIKGTQGSQFTQDKGKRHFFGKKLVAQNQGSGFENIAHHLPQKQIGYGGKGFGK
jgi:hypothetical protein